MLPPWADSTGLFISIKDAIYYVGKYLINFKHGQRMKTNKINM